MTRALTLQEVQHLISNKPLALVNLEHSDHNKKVIGRALSQLWASPAGIATFRTLQAFLADVAPKYRLSPSQDGVRQYLLRELKRISDVSDQKGTLEKLRDTLQSAKRQLIGSDRSKTAGVVSLTSWLP